MSLAYARFRRRTEKLCARSEMPRNAAELGEEIRRRFPQASPGLEDDLAACEEAVGDDALRPKRALALVQALDRHGKLLEALQAGYGVNQKTVEGDRNE